MRVLIDATTAREGGGITYISNVLPALLRQTKAHEYHVLISSLYQAELIGRLPEGVRAVTPRLPSNSLVRWLYLQAVVPWLLRVGGFDLLFSVSEISTIYAPCPRVVMVRNSNFYAPLNVFPGISQRWRLLLRRLTRQPFALLTIRNAERIVFVSESFRQTVMASMSLPAEKAIVIYHGLNPNFRPRTGDFSAGKVFDTRPYLLTVSSLAQHKNFETLLHGFARMIASGTDPDLQLVVAASIRNDKLYRSLLSQARALGIGSRVHFIGRVQYEDLVPLYQEARVFILPSRLETFGHPLVEAMACGTPVVASNLPVCREICQDAALYFSPTDAEELATQVLAILQDRDTAQKLIQRGLQRARDFSWDNTARELVKVFEEVVASSRENPA